MVWIYLHEKQFSFKKYKLNINLFVSYELFHHCFQFFVLDSERLQDFFDLIDCLAHSILVDGFFGFWNIWLTWVIDRLSRKHRFFQGNEKISDFFDRLDTSMDLSLVLSFHNRKGLFDFFSLFMWDFGIFYWLILRLIKISVGLNLFIKFKLEGFLDELGLKINDAFEEFLVLFFKLSLILTLKEVFFINEIMFLMFGFFMLVLLTWHIVFKINLILSK